MRHIPKRPRGSGGLWLAANTIGPDNWGEWLIPGLFVVWGAVLLIKAPLRPQQQAALR